MVESLVESAIDCVGPNGERHRIVVKLGRPYQTSTGEWACPVKIRGLYNNLCDIHGQDSLQALCLATSLVRTLLNSFVEGGGRIMFPNSDYVYDLNSIFGDLGSATSDQRS